MHILLMVMTTTLAMVAARNSSLSVSAASGDTSRTKHALDESSSTGASPDGQQMLNGEKVWHGQREEFKFNAHQMQETQLLHYHCLNETEIPRDGVEISDFISPKSGSKISVTLSEVVPVHVESTDTSERALNRTIRLVNLKKLLYRSSPESSQDDILSSSSVSSFFSHRNVTVSNLGACFCNQCVVNSYIQINTATNITYPECCYVKRFLNSGSLKAGKLALKVLHQYIITETKLLCVVHHSNTSVAEVPETTAVKFRELKQANCVLESLRQVYEWRKNYNAVKNNIIGDSDRYFDSDRYRKLLNFLDAALESLPEFLDAVNQLDSIGAACLDINWDPVFTSALGRNRSAFESFLREERSKLKKTLWTGLLFRKYLDPIVYSLLIVFGMISNGTLLLIFVRYKEMQSQRNVLLLNLVVVDLVNLTTVAPLYLLSKYYSPNLYAGEFGCRVFLCYRIIVRYNIEFSLVALTAQRYSVINSNRLSVRTRALLYVLSVWLMSVIATLPHVVAFVLRDFSCFSFTTEPGQIDFLIDHALMMLLSLSVPSVVIILSMLMARRLRRSIREMPGEGRQSFQKQEFARSRSARVVVALAVVFAFTHTPRALWFGLVPWSKIDRQSAAFLWIDGTLNYLYYLNSALNPCAMYFSCSIFRKTFWRYFCFLRDHKSKDSTQGQRTQQYYSSQICHL